MKTHARGFLWASAILMAAVVISRPAQAYYDPAAQRWITRDPIGEQDGGNLYQFVRGRPTSVNDAFGLSPLIDKKKENEEKVKDALDKIREWLENGKTCKEILDEMKEAVEKGKAAGAKAGDILGGIFGIGGIPAGAVAGLSEFADSSDCQRMLGCCKSGGKPDECVEKAQGCALDVGNAMAADTSSGVASGIVARLEDWFIKKFCTPPSPSKGKKSI